MLFVGVYLYCIYIYYFTTCTLTCGLAAPNSDLSSNLRCKSEDRSQFDTLLPLHLTFPFPVPSLVLRHSCSSSSACIRYTYIMYKNIYIHMIYEHSWLINNNLIYTIKGLLFHQITSRVQRPCRLQTTSQIWELCHLSPTTHIPRATKKPSSSLTFDELSAP